MLTIDDRKQILKRAVTEILAFREKKRGGPKKRNKPFPWAYLAKKLDAEEDSLETRIYNLRQTPTYGKASFDLVNGLARVIGCPVNVEFVDPKIIKAGFLKIKDEIIQTLELEKLMTKNGMTAIAKKYSRSREYMYTHMKKDYEWNQKELENFCEHFTSHWGFKFLKVTDAR